MDGDEGHRERGYGERCREGERHSGELGREACVGVHGHSRRPHTTPSQILITAHLPLTFPHPAHQTHLRKVPYDVRISSSALDPLVPTTPERFIWQQCEGGIKGGRGVSQRGVGAYHT